MEGAVWDQARQREPAPITLVPLVSGHLLCLWFDVVESRENCEILNQDVSGVLGLLGRAPSHVARFCISATFIPFQKIKEFPSLALNNIVKSVKK